MNHIERLSRKANDLYRRWVQEQIKEKQKMTLKEVKDKYFPNRKLEELRTLDMKPIRKVAK